jgi:acetyltransferase-like isoleucine patch superfamily enzyme
MRRLRVFGAGINAAKIVDLIAWQFADTFEVEGFYDDRHPAGAKGPGDLPILGTVAQGVDEVPHHNVEAFVALGTMASARSCEIFLGLRAAGASLPSLIAPSAHISPSVRVGMNSLVFPGVYLGCEVELGHLCWAHGGTVVEHHSRIGHNVLFGAAAAIGSFSAVGSHSFLGNGVVTVPEARIGCGTLVGTGSLVVKELPSHVIAYGRPALPIRPVRAGDEVPMENDIKRLAELGLLLH